ncbi:MAG: hypothetical protein OXK74_01985 [Gemmatimonadota bacterium]|nr:hypothetical protein [Gemmatimonadota bacterium]
MDWFTGVVRVLLETVDDDVRDMLKPMAFVALNAVLLAVFMAAIVAMAHRNLSTVERHIAESV